MHSLTPTALVLLAAALVAPVAFAQDSPHVARQNRARVTLTPPTGFEVAKQFQGYRQPTTGALIRVAHLSMTYDDARAALSRELLASRGAIERSRDEVRTADRRAATLIVVERKHERLDLREMMLLVGDKTGAALVTATYAGAYESQLRLPLRTALLSTRWVAEGEDSARAPGPKKDRGAATSTPPPQPRDPAPARPPAPKPTGATPQPPPPSPTPRVPPLPVPPEQGPKESGPAAPETPGPVAKDTGTRAPPKPGGALPRPDRGGGALRETARRKAPDDAELLAQLPFALNESSMFTTRRVLGGGLSLAVAGKQGRWSDPLFSVFSRERTVPAGAGRDEFVRRLVAQSGAFQSVRPETSGAVRIDGLDGVRALAAGTFEGGGDALVFKVVLFDSEDYYALTGRCALADRETYLGEFDRLAQSFRRADWAK